MNVTPFEAPGDRLESRLPESKPAYTPAEARAEAERCLYCHDAPCIKACPTSIDIPRFIQQIATGDVTGSARTILEANILGSSCARVCPVEVLCVGDCVYNGWHKPPIQIGRLQRFATDTAVAKERATGRNLLPRKAASHRRRVALVGAGPASLACAAYLALEGHEAVIFEKGALPGGLNTTGIAPYKLHVEDALREVEYVRSLGVEIRTGVEVGRDVTAASLLSEWDAVFLGVGLGADTKLTVPGEDGPGVVGATAFIERLKTEEGFSVENVREAVVVGGGNTAIDVARELAKVGVPSVTMAYRRSAQEMSGYAHELAGARLEGVRFLESTAPVSVVRDEGGRVTALRVSSTHHGHPVGDAREISCDLVVLAIGQSKLRTVAQGFAGVELDKRGCVVVDASTRRTGHAKVYAGGDCINGGKEVVNAVADGREAARAMIRSWQ